MRVCVPQLLQPCDCVCPGLHAPSPLHAENAPHVQSIWHVRVRDPQLPQGSFCVSPGMHEPPPEHIPLAQRQSALQLSMRAPHAPQDIMRVIPGEHSTSASGLHMPPHEVNPGPHSQRPATQSSPPAHGPPSQMPPQPSLSPQRTPGHVGTHASLPPSSSLPPPSNGGGTIGLGRVVLGVMSVETHAPLSPQVWLFSSQTACRVHGSMIRQRVSGCAQLARSTTRR